MPFADDQIDDALREAFASAPAEEVALNTLELRHPDFVDENGDPAHLRIVADGADFTAKLEATAPADAGLSVLFRACPFAFTQPERSEQPLPEAELTIDNVARELAPQLDRTLETNAPIEIVYREFLVSRAAIGPSFVMRGLQGKRVNVGTFRVTGRAGWFDLVNGRMPLNDYRVETHRGLEQ